MCITCICYTYVIPITLHNKIYVNTLYNKIYIKYAIDMGFKYQTILH